jgi:hypothetical protein
VRPGSLQNYAIPQRGVHVALGKNLDCVRSPARLSFGDHDPTSPSPSPRDTKLNSTTDGAREKQKTAGSYC